MFSSRTKPSCLHLVFRYMSSGKCERLGSICCNVLADCWYKSDNSFAICCPEENSLGVAPSSGLITNRVLRAGKLTRSCFRVENLASPQRHGSMSFVV